MTVPTSQGGTLNLDLHNNAETDVAGYNIYRSTTSGGGYAKVNASLATFSSYSDGGPTDGTIYYYVVTAVDTSANANESGYSNEPSGSPAAPAAVVMHVASVKVTLKNKGKLYC